MHFVGEPFGELFRENVHEKISELLGPKFRPSFTYASLVIPVIAGTRHKNPFVSNPTVLNVAMHN